MSSHYVGRYALVKLIGRGGMADVWVGKAYGASGFEKIVAVKLLAPQNVDKEEYQRALTDEARVLVHLKHPNIVDVYDLNFEAENPYLVMEFVEGAELRDVLRTLRAAKRRLPLPLAGFIVCEVAKALAYAHQRTDPETNRPLAIVHRDVSPSNVLVSRQGDVKLSDFGIAKSTLQSSHTQVGLIKGKFRYMSPEQAEGRPLDHRADQFALGLVLYECLFGVPAYDGPSDVGILQMARTGSVAIPDDADPEVKKILGHMLAVRPEDRFPDLNAFRKELSEILSRRGLAVDRDDLAAFLGPLALPQIQKSSLVRREVEAWDPQPTSQILTQQGRIETIAETARSSRKNRFYWLGGLGVVAAGLALAVLKFQSSSPTPVVSSETRPIPAAEGSLFVETTPPDAVVQVKYGQHMISRPAPISVGEIPFGVPVEVTASKKGFRSVNRKTTFSAERTEERLALELIEVREVQARFVAEPYAAVTVPGVFTNVETPIASKSLPPGDYDVVFYHAPSGRRVTARLKGKEGGSFLCSANMAVGDPSASPAAFCRSR